MAWGPGQHGDSQALALNLGKGASRREGPQALPGGGVFCALGPEAEGAGLKITGGSGGHLRWPDPPSCGDRCSNSRPAGTFRAPCPLLLLPPRPGEFQDVALKEVGAGGGLYRAGGQGPDPSPFSPTGYQLRIARWGSKCNPQPAAPGAPAPQCWVGVSACPHLATPRTRLPHHTAPWP